MSLGEFCGTPLDELSGLTRELDALRAERDALLAVLKKLKYAVEVLHPDWDQVDSGYWSILEQADLAIAKAEGKS